MKLSKSLFIIPAASLVFAVAVGSGACSASLSVTMPTDSYDLPSGFVLPAGYATSCTANQYIAVQYADLPGSFTTSWDCTATVDEVYFLCGADGTYTNYDCEVPTGDGWVEATDDGASDGGVGSEAGSGIDSGSGEDTGTGSEAGSGEDTGTGSDAGSGDDTGTGTGSDAGGGGGDAGGGGGDAQ
jgi:hypothetical protein